MEVQFGRYFEGNTTLNKNVERIEIDMRNSILD